MAWWYRLSRDTDLLDFHEIELTIKSLAERANAGKLTLDELQGGTFTITNGGVYGSLLSTPLLNPPQSGILGMHGIVDRPVVRDGEIVIRPIMNLALSYDHRIIDGQQSVGFLKQVKSYIEDPETPVTQDLIGVKRAIQSMTYGLFKGDNMSENSYDLIVLGAGPRRLRCCHQGGSTWL